MRAQSPWPPHSFLATPWESAWTTSCLCPAHEWLQLESFEGQPHGDGTTSSPIRWFSLSPLRKTWYLGKGISTLNIANILHTVTFSPPQKKIYSVADWKSVYYEIPRGAKQKQGGQSISQDKGEGRKYTGEVGTYNSYLPRHSPEGNVPILFKELELLVSRRGWGLGRPGQETTPRQALLQAGRQIHPFTVTSVPAGGLRVSSLGKHGPEYLTQRYGSSLRQSWQIFIPSPCQHYIRFVGMGRWREGRGNRHTRR